MRKEIERELREALLEGREYEFQYEGSSRTANAYVTTVGEGEWKGLMVDKAENGRIAVERVREMPAGYYSLIFMDIQMPEMNGYEAAAQIRASERADLKTLPIIAMSADVFIDDLKHAEDVGMNGHVAKPVEIDKLLEALEKWI